MMATMNDVKIYDDWCDPDLFRSRALATTYPVRGNYPGIRSHPDPLLLDMISKLAPVKWCGEEYTGSYQIRMDGVVDWIHSDMQQWAAVLFLNPEYPEGHGTTFWHDADGGAYRLGKKDPQCEYRVCGHVEGCYGRLVVYPGNRYHCGSHAGFGRTPDTARLTAVFFWNE